MSGRNQLRTFGAGSAPLPSDRLFKSVLARSVIPVNKIEFVTVTCGYPGSLTMML